MNLLNNRSALRKIDQQNMLDSIEKLSAQIRETVKQAQSLCVPEDFRKAKNIVVAGMGGSALPAHIIKSVYGANLSIPLEIVSDYRLPAYVNHHTIVLLSSYSGSTEEVLVMAKDAQNRKAKLIIVTTGGQLAGMIGPGIPGLILGTRHNPCGSPRMGLGYALAGQLLIFSILGLIKLTRRELNLLAGITQKYVQLYGVEQKNNLAKRLAGFLKNRLVLFIAAEHLVGNARVAANQMNENNKRLAAAFSLPELNHHLLEGMKLPLSNRHGVVVIVLNSRIYDPRISKRIIATRTIFAQNHIVQAEYNLREKQPLAQVCESLVFSSYLSYYGAMLEGIDPTAIPYVDFLKQQLK